MLKQTIKFIHHLRGLLFLMILMSYLYLAGLNPINITAFMGAKFSNAVGMSVSVPENPFNRLAIQLEEKEAQLDAREKAIDARERDMFDSDNLVYWFIGLGAGIGALFVLLVLNFYMDWQRNRRESSFERQISGNNNRSRIHKNSNFQTPNSK